MTFTVLIAEDPAPPAKPAEAPFWANPLFMIAIFGLFFLVVMLPAQRRKTREAKKMMDSPGATAPKMTPKQMADQKAWMEAAAVNDNHKLLEHMAGHWDMKVVATMPDSPPAESKAEEHAFMTLGGRFLHGKVKGQMMGQPFDGVSVMGYDNVGKKFVSTWTDSTSTNVLMETGTYDAATKTFTMKGEFTDPTTSKTVKTRTLTKMVDTDHYTMQFFRTMADGKETKVMEITSSRDANAKDEPASEGAMKKWEDAAKKAKDALPANTKGH